jgi:prolyl oligopeptidase
MWDNKKDSTMFGWFTRMCMMSNRGRRTRFGKNKDLHSWLETIQSPRVNRWVRNHNKRTTRTLTQTKSYAKIKRELYCASLRESKISFADYDRHNEFHDFFSDEAHPRGQWRKTSLKEYLKPNPKWDIVLDVDKLAKAEGKDWILDQFVDSEKNKNSVLVFLSNGGSDATEVREYNIKTKTFVKDGFNLPEAKNDVDWIDEDTVVVSSDLGKDATTNAGYAKRVKLWKRGTKFSEASVVFEAKNSDMHVRTWSSLGHEGPTLVITRAIDFDNDEHWTFDNGKIGRKIPFPTSVDFIGIFYGRYFAKIKKQIKSKGWLYPPGTLVSIPSSATSVKDVEIAYYPKDGATIKKAIFMRNKIYCVVTKDVTDRMVMLEMGKPGRFKATTLNYPKNGEISVTAFLPSEGVITVECEGFLVPKTLYIQTETGGKPKIEKIKSGLSCFDESKFVVKQKCAKSSDGTLIPFFIIHNKNMKLDGNNPTLMYGYGAFGDTESPRYLHQVGKVWLERGGVYVVANIRGGGEFGPDWHLSAQKQYRQRSFDDFISVSESLISRKITCPKKLAAIGSSNGGLVTAVMLTQRPDLYGAIVSEVPLTDMLRYNKLLAGASWESEYGNPSNPRMRKFLRKYSPYHNVDKTVDYPPMLLTTSTKDDRVHPSHARKMAARLQEHGKDVLFLERRKGGHSGNSDFLDTVKHDSLIYSFLCSKIMKTK